MPTRPFQLPVVLAAFLVVIAVVNAFADVYYWYWTIRWFDKPMHFAGGAWLASLGVWWYYSRKEIIPQKFLSVLGVCLAFSFGIGFIWEIYEAAVSFITAGHLSELWDTLGDLLFDILGSITVAILYWLRLKQKS